MQIKVKIIKSKRKTISLLVDRNAELIARVPNQYDKAQLDAFIKEKSDWILKHIQQAKMQQEKYKPFEIFDGAKIVILSKEYTIKLDISKRSKVVGDNIILSQENSKEHLIKLIKKIVKNHMLLRVKQIAEAYIFSYKNINVGGAKSVWGSCSYDNNLNFTYKLAFTPYFVIDYIIIHELCHTRVKNHSKKFYQEIKKIMPNYELAEQWLKQNKGIMQYL